MAGENLDDRVEAVRRFNRFYTRQIGVLQEGLLKSPFSLTEVRVLYEIAHRQDPPARELGSELGLDTGYLSRILRGFEKRGLISKTVSKTDGRQNLLRLTGRGRKAFMALDARARQEIATTLGKLSAPDQFRMIQAMQGIQKTLDAQPEKKAPYLIRLPQPGDMGWVVHRHGLLYAQEYGWDMQFEALVADIVAKFIKRYDPKRERCWIAEKDGEIAGCVFLVRKAKSVAQLRLLLVDPGARGLGIGHRLVEECLRFARQAGYGKMILWTNSVLHAARHLYQEAGFRLVRSERHHSFGHDLTGETWELIL